MNKNCVCWLSVGFKISTHTFAYTNRMLAVSGNCPSQVIWGTSICMVHVPMAHLCRGGVRGVGGRGRGSVVCVFAWSSL